MGAVYEAEHLQLGRRVALKRLHPELAGDEKAVQRFQREARAAGTIGHDHIVDVLDLGFAEDGAPYLVMELLVGESLAERLRRAGRLEPRRAARIAGEILSALEAVHGRGVIHRDLKPDNIFLCRRHGRRDFVKVLDFGISKVRKKPGSVTDALTKTGVMMGTPHYMSSEQARGLRDLDHRVDIYAAGVILYECLAGQLPFRSTNYHALLQSILLGEPQTLEELVPTLPPAFCRVIHKAMARNREDRFHDAHSMHAALRPFGAVALHAPGTMRPPPRGDAPTARMDSDAHADRLVSSGRLPEPVSGTHRSRAPRVPDTTPVIPLAAVPTAYVASSADFHPGSYASIRPSRPLAADTRPSWEPSQRTAPATRPDHSDVQVKASFLLALEAAIDGAHGAGSARSLVDADPTLAADWSPQLLSIARLPFAHVERLLDLTEGRFGGGIEAALDYGRRAGQSDRMGTHRRLLEGAPMGTLVRRLGTFYSAYFTAGELRARELSPKCWRLELHGPPVSGAFLAVLAGFFEVAFERAAPAHATTELVGGANGDAIELRWE